MWRQWRYVERLLRKLNKDSVSSPVELQYKMFGVDLPTNAVINQGDHLLFASIGYTNKSEINYCLCHCLATDEESDSFLQDAIFLSFVSRGGLQHPSDRLFITCVHAYQFYERVRGDKNSDAILMGSSNP